MTTCSVDDDTLAFADVLTSASTPRGVLLVAAYRAGADERVSAMARSMIGRGIGVEIPLLALDRSETDAIVGEVLARPGSQVELDLAWQLSEGNPFFALEVAAALCSDEAAGTGAYSAVDVRLERLPADTRQSLRSVAIVAHEFTADEFAALAAVDADRALEQLDVGMSLGVLPREGGNYRFRHDLVGDRLTETVSDADRMTAHAVAAERLAALGAPPARVVHHLLAPAASTRRFRGYDERRAKRWPSGPMPTRWSPPIVPWSGGE